MSDSPTIAHVIFLFLACMAWSGALAWYSTVRPTTERFIGVTILAVLGFALMGLPFFVNMGG